MKLKKHPKNIVDSGGWLEVCPPKKGERQWEDGRSAKALAEYFTKDIDNVPPEIEKALEALVPKASAFNWDAEYVTALPGKGEGRNHDAIMYNEDIVVTIEAKADEPFGNTVKKEMENASVNKLYRVSALLKSIFNDGFKSYESLRYQLLTASVGSILEAEKRSVKTAVLLVLVFESNGRVNPQKLHDNRKDIKEFLEAVNAKEENGFMVIPNNHNVKLYFKEIVI